MEKNPAGLQASSCSFDLTPLGSSLLAATGSPSLLYHHGDIVTRLPPCGSNLGCSALNPCHAAAVWPSPTAARMAVVRGSASPGAASRPLAITFQAHPEFSTPSGARVLERLLREGDAPVRGDDWLTRALPALIDERVTANALQLVGAAMKLLWPTLLPPTSSKAS